MSLGPLLAIMRPSLPPCKRINDKTCSQALGTDPCPALAGPVPVCWAGSLAAVTAKPHVGHRIPVLPQPTTVQIPSLLLPTSPNILRHLPCAWPWARSENDRGSCPCVQLAELLQMCTPTLYQGHPGHLVVGTPGSRSDP